MPGRSRSRNLKTALDVVIKKFDGDNKNSDLESKAKTVCGNTKQACDDAGEPQLYTAALLQTVKADGALLFKNAGIEALQQYKVQVENWSFNGDNADYCDTYKMALLAVINSEIRLQKNQQSQLSAEIHSVKQAVTEARAESAGNKDLTKLLNKVDVVINNNKISLLNKSQQLQKLVGDKPQEKFASLAASTKTSGEPSKLNRALAKLSSALSRLADAFRNVFSQKEPGAFKPPSADMFAKLRAAQEKAHPTATGTGPIQAAPAAGVAKPKR